MVGLPGPEAIEPTPWDARRINGHTYQNQVSERFQRSRSAPLLIAPPEGYVRNRNYGLLVQEYWTYNRPELADNELGIL